MSDIRRHVESSASLFCQAASEGRAHSSHRGAFVQPANWSAPGMSSMVLQGNKLGIPPWEGSSRPLTFSGHSGQVCPAARRKSKPRCSLGLTPDTHAIGGHLAQCYSGHVCEHRFSAPVQPTLPFSASYGLPAEEHP